MRGIIWKFALLFLPYYVCPTYNHYKKCPIICPIIIKICPVFSKICPIFSKICPIISKICPIIIITLLKSNQNNNKSNQNIYLGQKICPVFKKKEYSTKSFRKKSKNRAKKLP